MNRLPIVLACASLVLLAIGGWWTSGQEEAPAEPRVGGGTPAPDAAGPGAPGEPAPVKPVDPAALYTTGKKTRDGTGKYFMGREIAQFMSHRGIAWLERGNREEEEAPSKAVAALALKPTDVLADIGAGSGYYTFRIAPLVPKGKVVAVDIQPEMLEFLEKKEKELGMTNVEAHLGAIDDTKLPPESIDAALMVDAYHEFSHPYEMMRSLHKALRPGGRIILLEYRAEDPRVPIKPLHKMTQKQSIREMEVAGFRWKKTHDFLPWQHFMIFEKPQRQGAE